MGGAASYSGIVAKIRAMRSELLSEADFEQLAACRLSSQKAAFLGQFKPYAGLFGAAGDELLHRSDVEQRLAFSALQDFDKLYRFGNAEQKRFLKFFFAHFEAEALRRSLQAVLSREAYGEKAHAESASVAPPEIDRSVPMRPEDKTAAEQGDGQPKIGAAAGQSEETSNNTLCALHFAEPLLRKYTKLDLTALSQSRTLSEWVEGLEGTAYYTDLRRLCEAGNARAADYETALDMRYFTELWRRKNKLLSKEEQRMIGRTFGSRIDLLNMSWIYRAKKYFSMTAEEIYAMLVPVRARLSAEEIRQMAEAPGLSEFLEAERRTCYGARMEKLREMHVEESAAAAGEALLYSLYEGEARKHPFSAAPVNAYFYRKLKEIERIVYIIEASHYEEEVLT